MREDEPGGDADESGQGTRRDRLGEQQRAEHGRRHRAQREEHRDLGGGRVVERPEPEVVADPAVDADEEHRQPAARREPRQRAEESFTGGEDREERDRASMAKALTGSVGYFRRYGR